MTPAVVRKNAHGGPQVRVTISLRCEGDIAVLTAADDGPGISPANSERIFVPFFTTARKNGGTGLGLAIVKSLVSAHGGVLKLAPAGKGAVFQVELPCIRRGGQER
jgi:signal transduction histidine kinase